MLPAKPVTGIDPIKSDILSLPDFTTLSKSSPPVLTNAILIRGVELGISKLASQKKFRGPIHVYIGQELLAASVLSSALSTDSVTSTHRGHGHYLAKGGSVTSLIDELYGLPSGCNGGHGGSMHVADLSIGLYGANGIVGGGLPIACGLSLANQLDKSNSLTFCFFGDGALNQGVVYESLNIASFMKLPIVFICENNGFAQSTKLSDVSNSTAQQRASGLGIDTASFDFTDPHSDVNKISSLIAYLRSSPSPFLLDLTCYRFHRHFESERAKDDDYIDSRLHSEKLSKDPLKIFFDEMNLNIDFDSLLNSISSVICSYSPSCS